MQTFRVELGPASHPVQVGAGLLDELGRLAREAGLKPGRAAIVTDSNVAGLYAERAARSLREAGFATALVEISPGEASKFSTSVDNPPDEATDVDVDFLPASG